MADIDARSEPYSNPDGSITWLVHYTDGTTVWFKWDPKQPPDKSLKIQPVHPDPTGHGTLADGSIVESYKLPDGSRATQMGGQGGKGVDWITIHRPSDKFHWR